MAMDLSDNHNDGHLDWIVADPQQIVTIHFGDKKGGSPTSVSLSLCASAKELWVVS